MGGKEGRPQASFFLSSILGWTSNVFFPLLLSPPFSPPPPSVLVHIQYSIQNVNRLGELGACRLVAQAMRTFAGERCIQLLGLEAIEALAAKSESTRAQFEQVRLS